jgi:Fe2+ or Zn2+ uptake regulation protein
MKNDISTRASRLCSEWGLRKSKTRLLIFEFFDQVNRPMAIPEILEWCLKQKATLNKTTLYREVETLVNLGVLRPVQIAPRKISYELSSHEHHHHFVCTDCEMVTGVQFPEKAILQTEKQLEEQGMKITRHALEFFGLCQQCQS